MSLQRIQECLEEIGADQETIDDIILYVTDASYNGYHDGYGDGYLQAREGRPFEARGAWEMSNTGASMKSEAAYLDHGRDE